MDKSLEVTLYVKRNIDILVALTSYFWLPFGPTEFVLSVIAGNFSTISDLGCVESEVLKYLEASSDIPAAEMK